MGKCICLILSAIGALIAIGALSGLISYFALYYGRTKHITYEVFKASLTQFELTNNNTVLQYNLAINATAVNPNKKGFYHFDKVQVFPFIWNQSLFYRDWTAFDLDHERMVFLALSDKNSVPVPPGIDVVSRFKNKATVFDIQLVFVVENWTKIGGKRSNFKHWVYCFLKVPLITNSDGKSAQRFNVTKCIVKKADR